MKVFCSLLSLFLFVASAFSQDCNGTYEGGLALLKKRTEASVKEAVRKFVVGQEMLQGKPRPARRAEL